MTRSTVGEAEEWGGSEVVVRYARVRDALQPVQVYPVATGEPIRPTWLAITQARSWSSRVPGGASGHILYFLLDDGTTLAQEQFETLEIALDQAKAIVGIAHSEWTVAEVELPAEVDAFTWAKVAASDIAVPQHKPEIVEVVAPHSPRMQFILEEMRRNQSLYDEGFPDYFEDYLFLYVHYLQDQEILSAIVCANAATGGTSLLFLPKEHIRGKANPDLLVPNERWAELHERVLGPLEFYLAAKDGSWLVWAYHEPCLHIAGSTTFIDAVKSGVPDWEGLQSPWYEPGGIPVCPCGCWWEPGSGDWRSADWRCPDCVR